MQIFVKTLNGQSLSADVNFKDTIGSLKVTLEDKTGIKPAEQRLIYGGRQLEDERTFEDYNIQKMSNLFLVIRMLGGLGMQIFVKDLAGKTLPFDVDHMETIGSFKVKLEDKTGIKPAEQRLLYAGTQLEDEMTFRDYNIQKMSNIFLVTRVIGGKGMQIFVKDLTGKTLPFDVEHTETIASLKVKLEERTGIKPDEQRLIYGGKQLDEERTFTDYNIQKMSNIFLVTRGLGGAGWQTMPCDDRDLREIPECKLVEIRRRIGGLSLTLSFFVDSSIVDIQPEPFTSTGSTGFFRRLVPKQQGFTLSFVSSGILYRVPTAIQPTDSALGGGVDTPGCQLRHFRCLFKAILQQYEQRCKLLSYWSGNGVVD